MKRLLMILLAVVLLAGCGKKPEEPTQPTENKPPQIEGVTYHYIEDSAAEQQTDGAVRAYSLESDTYFDLVGVGSNLLVLGQKSLTVLSGEWGEEVAIQENGGVRPTSVMDNAVTGFAYYSPNSRQVIVLNPQLQSLNQAELPKEIVGDPCISLAHNEVYYSTGTEIRALKMDTGISRLLRQQTAATLTLQDIYFDGTVLLCRITDETGNETVEYISAETGQTLGEGENVLDLQTCADQYIAYWQDGIVKQTAFGTRGGTAQCFLPARPDEQGGRMALLAMNGVLDYEQKEDGLALSFYDLSVGRKTAQVALNGVHSPVASYTDGTYIWILATDESKTSQCLYRWDVTKSAAQETTACIGTLYTADAPDTQGLAQCQELANSYQSQYGVKVRIWQDAAEHTGGNTVKAEYNPQVIQSMMEQIKPVLEMFPEKFLLKTVEAGWIQIGLVRSIDNSSGWVQFWEEGDCWILLSAEADAGESLIQGLAYGIDSHVLGNSRDFDTWGQLNPGQFTYSYSNQVDEDSPYLTGDNRAFTDALAMGYPHEDRCRVFYHAMLPENEAMFQSPIMQAKLLRICEGIREAYSLEKKTETYAWEQYLETSIAYVPKT